MVTEAPPARRLPSSAWDSATASAMATKRHADNRAKAKTRIDAAPSLAERLRKLYDAAGDKPNPRDVIALFDRQSVEIIAIGIDRLRQVIEDSKTSPQELVAAMGLVSQWQGMKRQQPERESQTVESTLAQRYLDAGLPVPEHLVPFAGR